MARGALALAALLLVWLAVAPASAWIENHVVGDQVQLTVDAQGKAEVEHRLTLRTNGSEHLKSYLIEGLDADAKVLPNAYAVPERDAASGALDNAVPLRLEILPPAHPGADASLRIEVDDKKGLWRGTYLLVLRYATDLRARGFMRRDGAYLRLSWRGPRFSDGFDSARATFIVPRAPTEPRAVEASDEEDGVSASLLSEVRRGGEHDEVELLRPYAGKGEALEWSLRVDPRAFDPLPVTRPAHDPASAAPAPSTVARPSDKTLLAGAALLFLLALGLVVAKGRETAKHAAAAGATARPLVPLPLWLRAPVSAAALVSGVALQLWYEEPLLGAVLVALAALFTLYGGARTAATMRGPGRWLSVSEEEGLGRPPRLRGAYLDSSTRAGKGVLASLLLAFGVGIYLLAQRSWLHGLELAFDAVFLGAVFGSGRLAALPPDMALEPARFLRRLAPALRRRKELTEARIVARIRIPTGAMDPDELRLMVAPRLPRRGFQAIEVGVSFALGFGGRATLPEVLVRVAEGSPCEEALSTLRDKGRITPGRRPDERVMAFSPRLPTVGMTADIVAALALRVSESAGASVPASPARRRPPPEPPATNGAPSAPELVAPPRRSKKRKKSGDAAA